MTSGTHPAKTKFLITDDAVRKHRFEREARVISGLHHPSICTLHEVRSQKGIAYLVIDSFLFVRYFASNWRGT